MEQRGEDVLVWVDRRKNVLKLAQGEYVSVSRLEALFAGSADVANVYLYGNSLRSYVLGVVVPSEGLVEAAREGGRVGSSSSSNGGGNGGREGEREELVARLKPLLRQRLDAVAKEAGLASYEVPRDFIVQLDGFTRENNLLTDSNKLARARLKQGEPPPPLPPSFPPSFSSRSSDAADINLSLINHPSLPPNLPP
jgi:fatty acid CoA ligase FadD9